MSLELIFGMFVSNLQMYLKFGQKIIVQILKHHPAAKIQFTTPEEVSEFTAAVNSKQPVLTNVWAAIDGAKLILQQSGNALIQNQFYI